MRTENQSDSHSTVFAVSTAQGRAGVAIIRVSGPQSRGALDALAKEARPLPRHAQRLLFRDPDTGEPLDDGLALWFPGPASFTGEDVVEFHIHGGRAVVDAMLAAIGALPGLKPAQPGEFSRRAFENGKLDLTQVEGLADLIDAETESQRSLAFRQMAGALRQKADAWREDLVTIQGLTEAAIDFSDEADVAADALFQARQRAKALVEELGRHLDDRNRGEILRGGFKVAVLGPPNAGKSSLINQLAGRDAVIVSDEAGTTRDVVELHLNLDGYRVIIADTAGVRETNGAVEREGIRRALAWADEANLLLWLFEGSNSSAMPAFPEIFSDRFQDIILVRTKVDLEPNRTREAASPLTDEPVIGISSKTGQGLDELVAAVSAAARSRISADAPAPIITQARHRFDIQTARDALAAFASHEDDMVELAAENVRSASFALGRLTGRVDVEEILGAIFSRFCIGK